MKYFRIENHQVSSGVDEFDNPVGPGRTELYLHSYEVLKETPKGVWIQAYGTKKFILQNARKKFACPTIEEAIESFIARKKRQIRILSGQLENAKMAQYYAEHKVINGLSYN